jgi:hypothetical protein
MGQGESHPDPGLRRGDEKIGYEKAARRHGRARAQIAVSISSCLRYVLIPVNGGYVPGLNW